jgi:hypothetical protein
MMGLFEQRNGSWGSINGYFVRQILCDRGFVSQLLWRRNEVLRLSNFIS